MKINRLLLHSHHSDLTLGVKHQLSDSQPSRFQALWREQQELHIMCTATTRLLNLNGILVGTRGVCGMIQ
jgi:hypothetical protein